MFRTPKRRRGVIAVMIALCLVSMVAIVAIALDGGVLLDQRRRVQAAADAAALAAAIDLYNNGLTNKGLDTSGTARASALSVAASNGYNNDGIRSIVTVNIPPVSGPYANRPCYAEVNLQFNQTRGFGQIFGSGDIPIRARAVARGIPGTVHKAIIVLDPTNAGAMSVASSANVQALDGAIVVDSIHSAGCILRDSASVYSTSFYLSGTPGYSLIGNARFAPGSNLLSGQTPVLDPFRYVQLPSPISLPLQNTSTLNISGNLPVTLNPGLYRGGINITGPANVTLNPGIYYMQGGVGFSYTGQGSLVGNGVMLYNDNSGGAIKIAGQGQVNLSPLTAGPYRGMTLFQDRSSSMPLSVTGNGNMSVTGTFYAANAALNIQGNGAFNNIGSLYVSYDLNISGNGNVTLNNISNPLPTTRLLGLVE